MAEHQLDRSNVDAVGQQLACSLVTQVVPAQVDLPDLLPIDSSAGFRALRGVTIRKELKNSEISENTSTSDGGGIRNFINATLILSVVAVVNNRSSRGGGLFNFQSTVKMSDSLIAKNTADKGQEQACGGILHHSGELTLTRSSVRDNSAPAFDATGGGICTFFGRASLIDSSVSGNLAAQGEAGGIFNIATLILSGSTVSFNKAAIGGGIETGGLGSEMTMTNSTVSTNHADRGGGGILHSRGTLTLNNVTVTRNDVSSSGDLGGEGILVSGIDGLTAVGNSIVAGNSSSVGPDCRTLLSSDRLTSQGFNLIQDTHGCVIDGDTTGNILGAGPNLGPLQNNGGPTLTHALPTSSPIVGSSGALRLGQPP